MAVLKMREATLDQDLDARIARNVRHLLIDHAMQQGQLAERIGVHPTAMSKMLRGARSWSIEDLYRTADTFGVTVDEIVQWAPRGSNPQPTANRPAGRVIDLMTWRPHAL